MFNALYRHYLESEQPEEAKRIGEELVRYTLALLQHFDSISMTNYNRPVKQIYLGHDNVLHTHYLPALMEGFRNAGYTVVSLEEALSDPVYQQKNTYYKKWGISWLYRWIEELESRKKWMMAEPDMQAIQEEFNTL